MGSSYERGVGSGVGTFGGAGGNGGAVNEVDTRSRSERALATAMRLIAVRSDAASNAAAGSADRMGAGVDRQGSALASVDASGNVYADYAKVEAMTNEAVEAALNEVPEDTGEDAANPTAAFQAAFQSRVMREQLKELVRTEVQNKAKAEVRHLRRKLLLAAEALKPKPPPQRRALMQAAFLAAHDDAPGRGGGASSSANAGKMSLLVAPDPYDESLFGVTNLALYQAKNNTRVTQQLLEYVLGYSSVVDPEDLEEIEAGSQGLQVSRGKSMRELCLKYAQHLDKTLPERHRGVLTSMIRRAAEEHARRARMGQTAEDGYNDRARESAGDVKALNRDVWLKEMFPDAAWPVPRRRGDGLLVDGGGGGGGRGGGRGGGANDPLDATASADAISRVAARGGDEGARADGRGAATAAAVVSKDVRMGIQSEAGAAPWGPGVRGGGGFGLGGGVAEPGTVVAGGRSGWASMEAATVAAKPVRAPPHNPTTGAAAGTAVHRRAGDVQLCPGGGAAAAAGGRGGAGPVNGAGTVMGQHSPAMGLYDPVMTGAGGMMQQQRRQPGMMGGGGGGGGGGFGTMPVMGGQRMNPQQQQAMLYGGNGTMGGGFPAQQQQHGTGSGGGYT